VGQFFIVIDPESTQTTIDALPWIATHEICHCLEADAAEIVLMKTIASLTATIFSTFIFGWSLVPSIGLAMLANVAAHATMSRRAENRADDFANKYASEEDKQKAILFLEELKNSRPEAISSYPAKLMLFLLYPSEDARIAKIRATLLDQKKVA